MSNYPLGAENDVNAPYNKLTLPEIEVEVEILLTLTKKVKIHVDNYEIDDYFKPPTHYIPNEDLTEAVKKQVILPNETKEFKDWKIESFYVEKI